MIMIKRILNKMLFPHIAVMLLLILVSAVMLIYAFAEKAPIPVVQYAAYGLSAYTLTVLCIKIPAIYKKARTIKQENKYAALYFSDAALRVKISLYSSFAINVLYAVMQLGFGFFNHSVWFYTLSGYYLLLAVMRFLLLKNRSKNSLGKNLYKEYLDYRLCGIILLLMNAALSVIAFYIVTQNKGFAYQYIMTIAMAAYTFIVFTTAIVNVIRYRKYNSPVISASKIINLAAAFVSMFSLETAMLTAFGEENSSSFRKIMTSCTGAVICTIVLAMAIYMIAHSTKQLYQIEKENYENE